MTVWQILSVECGGTMPTPLPDAAGPLVLVFPADAEGEALAGAVAAQTGAAVLGRITALRVDGADLVATRSTHGGRLSLDLRLSGGLAVATSNDADLGQSAIALGRPADMPLECTPIADQQVSLEGARIVLGGGRGLDEDGFVQLERIARLVGGAVSASLAAVDLGLAPVSRQVGQSGKFVNPVLYLAAGMSGTPQHFAGVGARARIVAINNDPESAIFGLAQAGAVADARVVLPLVAEVLAELEGRSE